MRKRLAYALRGSFWSLLLCLLLGGSAAAQVSETAASINGQVTDATGAIIPGATVVVANEATGEERRVQTNDDGLYVAIPLSPGTYTITVEQTNFKRYVQNNVVLNATDRRPINIVLEPGLASETVTITADDINSVQDSPTGQTLISGAQVLEIPLVNRDYTKLLELVPGVSSSALDETDLGLTNRVDFSINGMRRNGINIFIDGVSNTDVGSNITQLSTPTVDSIKEFKVLTSNYTAEVGRSGGGTITVVTRGGGNDFHGSLYEFVRNDRFNANSFFNNRLGTNPLTGEPRADVPKLRYNTFGGTLSGPVYLPRFGEGGPAYYSGRDKTFFFFSEDVRRIIRGTTDLTALVPSVLQRQGDFSQNLGLPLFRAANGTSTTTSTDTPLLVTDTNGNVIQARSGMVFRPSDGRAYAGNVIPLSDISPIARSLIDAYPLPNIGTVGFTSTPVNFRNTRQEVIRIDHNFNDNQRLFGRYTHDLNETEESGGLFNGIVIPNISTTETRVPGQTFVVALTSVLSPTIVNEVAYNFSSNFIASKLTGRGRRSTLAGAAAIPEAFPENNENVIPTFGISGISTLGALQGFQIQYKNQVIRDNVTWTRGNHTIKFGGEISFENKNENANANTQGIFNFNATQSRGTSGTTALTQTGVGFADFLLGRANTYTESVIDPTVHLTFGRHEFYAQDTWKVRPNLTLDYGVRYQVFRPVKDRDDNLASFDPVLYNPANAPICANATCTLFVRDPVRELNGIAIAGQTSRFGRSTISTDKNNFSPRVGFAWDPFSQGRTIIRAGYGFYYDQVLVGVFENATFFTPPFNSIETFTSSSAGTVTLANPTAGATAGTFGARSLVQVTAPDIETPEIQQWSLGIQHEVFRNAVADISYVGTKGDKLLRPINYNIPQPADVLRVGIGSINAVRPFRGFTNVASSGYIESSGISRYHGLLSSFSYRPSTDLTVTAAYTFSKTLTNATNDRDAIDIPQNPLNKDVEYAEARTSRPHIFSASYIYVLPFFTNSENALLRNLLGGWEIAGITNIESGPPVPRVVNLSTLGGIIGNLPNLVSDPNGGRAGQIDPISGLPFIFDPDAFATPAAGTFGNAPRAFARLPGRNNTNLTLTKNFYFDGDREKRLQLRAEAFNVFNHTQFISVGAVLGTATLGRPLGTRLPREFQFGLKLYF